LLEKLQDWVVCGEAENGSDGIDKAQMLHPDLIVIDLAMPVMNGIDASRALKQLMPTVPIVMFTTFADPYMCVQASLAGNAREALESAVEKGRERTRVRLQ
jgi:DNA-binding NarL/FixJ family response regulator